MYGLMHAEVKLQGFGTGPGIRLRLSFWSFPPVTWTVWRAHSENGVVWLRVRTVSVASHDRVNVIEASLKASVTVPSCIGSLNVITMFASSGTPDAPSAGFVETMNGGATPQT